MENIKIHVILGSTREGRFSDKPGHWIFDELKKREGIETELIDLRDWPLPFFNDPVSPSQIKDGNYANPEVKKWAAKIKEADAYVVVAPEYNHGYPAVLKNALDSVYAEWNNKPIGFVSYGNVGGARSVEQLREVAIELQMAPIRSAVHIPSDVYMAVMKDTAPTDPEKFKSLAERATTMIDQLLWWAKALKTAREAK